MVSGTVYAALLYKILSESDRIKIFERDLGRHGNKMAWKNVKQVHIFYDIFASSFFREDEYESKFL